MAGIWSRFFGSSISTATGYGIGSALGPALSPVTQRAQNEANELYPLKPVPATIAAALVAAGKLPVADGLEEARKSGYNETAFARLVAEARGAPQLASLLELWRRGEIDDAAVVDGLQANGLQPRWIAPLQTLKRALASPSDAVRWAVREAFNPPLAESLGFTAEFPEAFADYAAKLGISRDDAERHWIAHWELVSATQLAEMLHRKIIDPDTYDSALKALDYPAPWRDRLRRLADRIPPLSDMIRFAVKDAYSPDTVAEFGLDAEFPDDFAREGVKWGMSTENLRLYWRAHWRNVPATQLARMLFRGIITPAQYDTALKVLDYSPFWREKVKESAHLIPGRIDLRRLYVAGKISRADTKAGYQKLGYTADDAEKLTQLAEAAKGGASAARDLTATHWAGEYEGGFIDAAEYGRRLGELGYDAAEVDLLVQLGDARKVAQARNRAVSRIATSYIGYQIDRPEAEAALAKTQIRPEARARMVDEWTIAREANVKQMTAAQVRSAYKKGQYTQGEALAELAERGWRPVDAEKYLASA